MSCRASLRKPIAKHQKAVKMTRLLFSARRHGTSKRLKTTKRATWYTFCAKWRVPILDAVSAAPKRAS